MPQRREHTQSVTVTRTTQEETSGSSRQFGEETAAQKIFWAIVKLALGLYLTTFPFFGLGDRSAGILDMMMLSGMFSMGLGILSSYLSGTLTVKTRWGIATGGFALFFILLLLFRFDVIDTSSLATPMFYVLA